MHQARNGQLSMTMFENTTVNLDLPLKPLRYIKVKDAVPPNKVAVRWGLEGREAGGRPSLIPPPLIYDAFDGYMWGASVSELFQMAWLVEGVSLLPQGRIYSSCRSALTATGKSRTGATSLSAKQTAPQALDEHMPPSPCKPEQPLRNIPCPSSCPCRFLTPAA